MTRGPFDKRRRAGHAPGDDGSADPCAGLTGAAAAECAARSGVVGGFGELGVPRVAVDDGTGSADAAPPLAKSGPADGGAGDVPRIGPVDARLLVPVVLPGDWSSLPASRASDAAAGGGGAGLALGALALLFFL